MPGLLDVFFPPSCVGCQRVLDGPGHLCPTCEELVERADGPCCTQCMAPGFQPPRRCPRCWSQPPPFRQAHAPFLHSGPIAHAIHLLKYEDRPDLARPLAELACRAAGSFIARAPQEVVAVPLHASRFRHRRYDQAHLIAHRVALLTGKRYLPDVLVRTSQTRRQIDLSMVERERNVESAFAAEGVDGLSLLLVDDVFTTGATARSAARCLREAGASEVWVLTIARA